MKSIALYQPRDTFIHQGVDALTKLTFVFCCIVCAFTIPSFVGAAVLFVFTLFILAWARELSRALKTILGSLLLIATIFVVQGLFNPSNRTLLWTLGPVHFYKEGLLFAVTISFRVVTIIAASCILVLTTSPSGVVEACVRRGLSPKIGYVITAILTIIPTMMTSAARIREAQQARGLAVEGSLVTRLKALLPLLGPVVMSSFMSLQERAMALEVRGFSVRTRNTFFNEARVTPGMGLVRIGLIVATIAIIVWRVVR